MDNTEVKRNRVSFSQYSTFLRCNYKWYLDYCLNLRKWDGNINTAFGTSIHETFQKYLDLLYNHSLMEADSLDCYDFFKKSYDGEITKLKEEGKELSDEEYDEFYNDGIEIITEFLKTSNRLKYFPSRDYELVGIEIPLELPIKNNVSFTGFIDVVLREKSTNKYKIIDFKTSFNGWNKYVKEDFSKISQLHLYKAMYSKKFNVPLSDIEVEFFIVKRRLYENVSFPQSKIQIFKPESTKAIINESLGFFIEFLNYGFTKEGEYRVDQKFLKNPGTNKKHCKYCMHYKNSCDGKKDKI
jgi:hypothetical protein